jgi:cAMP-dependent protein kinase regulator
VKDAAQRKREKYDNFLQTVPLLQSMDPYDRSKLGDAVREETFKEGDFIIRQGDPGEKFYLLDAGTAIATKSQSDGSQTTVMEYNTGAYFGEKALITNETRAANVIATSEVLCLSLEIETFKRLLGNLDDIFKKNMD